MVRGAGSLLVGQAGRLALQAGYFVLLAHGLGVDDYGAFAGMLAIVSIVSPFSTVGAINLLIRDVAVDPDNVARYYGTTRLIAWIGGALLIGGLLALSPVILPTGVSIWIFVCIAVSEIVAARLLEVASATYQALHQMTRVVQIQLCLPIIRCLTAGILVGLYKHVDLLVWTLTYLVSSTVCALIVGFLAGRAFGRGEVRLSSYVRQWRSGILFSISLASQSVYNDIDKAMLASLGGLAANGVYSAAYRFVEIGFAPMRAVLAASYPKFFYHGAHGLRASVSFAKSLMAPSLGLCLVGSCGLYVAAPLLPEVLGSDYSDAVAALRGLALLPLLRGVQYLAADALTGAGHQGGRSIAQAGIALLNVGLNFVLIPRYSWEGAIVATLACDGLLAICLWIMVFAKLRRREGSTGEVRVAR